MMNTITKLNFDKYKCMSGSVLKTIALVTMIIDHIGSALLRNLDFAIQPLFVIGSRQFTMYAIFRLIGRIAFPLYSFLLVEGFLHTKNRKKYGINLLVFAVISEIPYNLEHTGTLFFKNQNVFFTLFFGYLGLCFFERFKDEKVKQALSIGLLFCISWIFHSDYRYTGFVFILLLYLMRDRAFPRALIGSSLFPNTPAILVSFGFMGMYNGNRGFIKNKAVKYMFYAAYPVHLFILYLIKLKYIGYS